MHRNSSSFYDSTYQQQQQHNPQQQPPQYVQQYQMGAYPAQQQEVPGPPQQLPRIDPTHYQGQPSPYYYQPYTNYSYGQQQQPQSQVPIQLPPPNQSNVTPQQQHQHPPQQMTPSGTHVQQPYYQPSMLPPPGPSSSSSSQSVQQQNLPPPNMMIQQPQQQQQQQQQQQGLPPPSIPQYAPAIPQVIPHQHHTQMMQPSVQQSVPALSAPQATRRPVSSYMLSSSSMAVSPTQATTTVAPVLSHSQVPSMTSSSIPSIMPNFGSNSFLHSGEFRFVLEVAQQPRRARMCGFGDKDRRQITPPPCVRLRIFNIHTGAEFTDISSIDTSFYALLVELWSVDMSTNMSLVHPSGQIYHSQSHGNKPQAQPQPQQSQRQPQPAQQYPYPYPQAYYPQQGQQQQMPYYPPQPYRPGSFVVPASSVSSSASSPSVTSSPPTRNLIGSLVATAHKLHDLNDTQGIWFILQDLSVRTEGEFRLKFSFVNLAEAVTSQGSTGAKSPGRSSPLSASSSSSSHHNTSSLSPSAPIITNIFSEPFRSYSAKKFPGVIDSTELSRCFANQGIKIPIRREHKSKDKKPS